jgi:hypothetical protein
VGLLFFVMGSAFGAVFAWFVSCREPSLSTVVVLNGVVGGLLGIVMSASWGTTTPATEAGLGLLSTAAPLTLCITPVGLAGTSGRITSAVRRLAARLGIALICGISCATLGFVSVESVRSIEIKENQVRAVNHPGRL